MKYKLKLPLPGYEIGHIIDTEIFIGESFLKHPENFPDFFEPIVEKKTYDSLRSGEVIWIIEKDGSISDDIFDRGFHYRSETFLTREEAEDEHKRREWACRKDKFIPKEGETFWTAIIDGIVDVRTFENNIPFYVFCVNSGLAFRSREECKKAIKEHDLIRLFYTIR